MLFSLSKKAAELWIVELPWPCNIKVSLICIKGFCIFLIMRYHVAFTATTTCYQCGVEWNSAQRTLSKRCYAMKRCNFGRCLPPLRVELMRQLKNFDRFCGCEPLEDSCAFAETSTHRSIGADIFVRDTARIYITTTIELVLSLGSLENRE